MRIRKKHLTRLLAVLLWGLVTVVPGAAQEESAVYEAETLEAKRFNESSWADLQKALDYSGKPEKPKTREPREPREREEPTPPRDPPFDFDFPDLTPLAKILLALIVLGLLAWGIYSFVIQNELKMDAPVTGESPDGPVDLGAVNRLEEELDRRDVNPYLVKAEQEANYHLAVRLHFLALLKQLHEQRLISWKKDRTNRYYLNEMRSREEYPDFRDLTLTFERVWYGNQHPGPTEYQAISTAFQAYRQKLNTITAA